MKETILVTGGTGFIGSHTTVELQEAGFSKAEEIEERILHTGGYAKLQ